MQDRKEIETNGKKVQKVHSFKNDQKPVKIGEKPVRIELEKQIYVRYNYTRNRALIHIKTGDVRSQQDIY